MTQSQLERHVARATGETLSAIRRRGFSLVDPELPVYDSEPQIADGMQTVDWDARDAHRVGVFPARPRRRLVAA